MKRRLMKRRICAILGTVLCCLVAVYVPAPPLLADYVLVGYNKGGGAASASFGTVHHWVASCADATTCAVTATEGVASGDLVAIAADTVNANYITSTDINTGTVPTDAYFRPGRSSRTFLSGAYILSSPAAVTAGNPITVTFAQTTGGAKVEIWDVSYSGGTPALDAVGDTTAESGVSNPYSGVSLTLTGNPDVVFQMGRASSSTTAVSSPWSSLQNFSTAGFAAQAGITSFTAPTWTASSPTNYRVGAMAFGFNPTPCVNHMIQDFSAGAAGNAPAAADLRTSTRGATGYSSPAISANEPWYWTVTTPSTYLTYNASAYKANNSLRRLCVGGATYAEPGTHLGLQLDTTGQGTTRFLSFFMPGNDYPGYMVSTSAAATVWWQTSMTGSDTANMDVFAVYGSGSGGTNFANAIYHAGGIALEGATTGSAISVSANTWYQIALLWTRNGTVRLRLYDASGNQVGNENSYATGLNTAWPQKILIGDISGAANTTGRTVWWSKVQVCYEGNCLGAFPILE